jgi:proline racemase
MLIIYSHHNPHHTCGTGTCAIMAMLHARGLLKVGDQFEHYSIVGSQFIGTILEETTIKKISDPDTTTCANNANDGSNNTSATTSAGTSTSTRTAIIPQIDGSAYITQYSEVVVDLGYDPFPDGFKVAIYSMVIKIIVEL